MRNETQRLLLETFMCWVSLSLNPTYKAENLTMTKKLLVHMCCGPCSIVPLKDVLGTGFEVWGFFHNPNIHPRAEFERRLQAVKKLAAIMDVKVIYDENYTPREFIKGVKDAGSRVFGVRCVYCYSTRLEAVARKARELGFDSFTSSLLYSRYQDHGGIIAEGQRLAQKYDLHFLYEDFRTGWMQGIEYSKRLRLYRQKYCGCIYSKIEAAEEKRRRKEERKKRKAAM